MALFALVGLVEVINVVLVFRDALANTLFESFGSKKPQR